MNISIFLHILMQNIYALNVNWNNMTDGIGRLFGGGNWTDPQTGITHYVHGILGGDMTIISIVIFLFFFIVAGVMGLSFIIGSVVFLPLMFFLFQYLPHLQFIVAIIVGLILGFGLHRIIRR